MYRSKCVSVTICTFLTIVLMNVTQAQALLYNFGDPNQLSDFVIDEGDWEIKNGVLEGKLPAAEYLGVYLNYPGSKNWTDYVVEAFP